ncbi:hypothetical protein ABK040_014127 [Willaertia magna]
MISSSSPFLPSSSTANTAVNVQSSYSPYHDIPQKLSSHILKQLIIASKSSNFQQNQILENLFENLIQIIDTDILLLNKDITQLVEKSPTLVNNNIYIESTTNICYHYYFQIVADYFIMDEFGNEKAKEIQHVLFKLFTNNYFSCIYVLLFYKWLFISKHLTLIGINIFLKGVNKLFWSDIDNKSLKFYSIFKFLQQDILLSRNQFINLNESTLPQVQQQQISNNIDSNNINNNFTINEVIDDEDVSSQIDLQKLTQTKRNELISIIFKFFFFYENRDCKFKLKTFLIQLSQINKYNNEENFKMLSDLFVNENIPLLSTIRDEEILLSLLSRFKLFSQLEISNRTKIKLQASIYACTRVGAPNYPERNVRHLAQKTLDELFPSGKYARWWLNTSFRLFHYYWPLSFINWTKEKIKSICWNLPKKVIDWLYSQINLEPELIIDSSALSNWENHPVDDEYNINYQ